ncbi:MAG: hypothetical protein Q8O06_02725 [Acetobacterium sp.]|nr:hypothetical protein [Acetobacterium sp.]
MAKVYVLASICNQGKTTTAIALEHYFKEQGLKTACLQKIKGQYDVGLYLKKGCYHYSIPLEAAKSRDAFERWLPKGYDIFILELSMAFSPIGSAYLDIFQNYNEVISYELRDQWNDYVPKYLISNYLDSTATNFWEKAHHNKKVQNVFTKVPVALDEPCVDRNFIIHHPEKFVFDSFEPKMTFPQSNKKAVAFGAFPGEYWDIFPNLKWSGYDPCDFQNQLKSGGYDMAIIGQCSNQDLKFKCKPETTKIICYQPSVYLNISRNTHVKAVSGDLQTINTILKEKPVGTFFGSPGTPYASYNNRFWTAQNYPEDDIVHRDKNIMYCNGWVLPQYLIKEGLLEV